MKKNQKTAENGSFRVVTWNVNGIRSIAKKDFFTDLKLMNPDVLCLQETKAAAEEVVEVLDSKHGYHVFANSSKARKGYSGTAILTREQPVDVLFDMGVGKHDQEGRVIAAEYSNFFVVSVYVPNSGEGLARLDYRTEWDKDFNQYLFWFVEILMWLIRQLILPAQKKTIISRQATPKKKLMDLLNYWVQVLKIPFVNIIPMR
jgi:hypothetical protein